MKAAARSATMALLLILSPAVAADLAPTVVVSADLPRSGTLTQRDLEALGATTVEWVDHRETHRVTGVPLDKVLAAFGFTPGPRGKQVPVAEMRAGWRKVLVVIGIDGYQSAFSCAELSPEIGATRALVSWSMDGAPLREGAGPFRLVFLTDHEPARSVRGLERLVVVDVNLPPAGAKERAPR